MCLLHEKVHLQAVEIVLYLTCLLQKGVRCGKGPWAQTYNVSSLQSLTQTCGDKARAVLLMARSDSGKNCGSPGKNQTQLGQSSMLTLLCLVLSCRNADSQLFDKVRGHDIKLLRYLSVRYICDLMVENKKVKFGLKWVWVNLFLCRLWFAASVALACELLSGVHSASWEQSLEEFYSRVG